MSIEVAIVVDDGRNTKFSEPIACEMPSVPYVGTGYTCPKLSRQLPVQPKC